MSFENILFLFGKILLLGTINKFVLLLLYMSYKGIYKPSNPKKYKGDQSNIIYRSLWERKFMNYCDLNENILEWASEEFWIPYLDPTTNRVRRYFPDFFIKYKDKTGDIRRSVIEVKPMRETLEPKATKGKSRKTMINESMTYVKNQAKWKAAREFCADRKLEFKIMTEKELGIR
jgi:hypothetical protein|tara:strand:- start:305 stop:829 length:525 start_codon:yes stop_codon:yes gene_type:complete